MKTRIQALFVASFAFTAAGAGCTSVLGDISFDRATGGAGGGTTSSTDGTGGTGGATTSTTSTTSTSTTNSTTSTSTGGTMCAPGMYEFPAGSGTCIDDPCLPNPCDYHGLCTNDTGAAVCTCVYFVDGAATGASTGDSWQDAFTDIQAAVGAAGQQVKAGAATCEVWVKKGTYHLYNPADTHSGVALQNNVGLYGGFAGNEKLRTEADPKSNVTILSGQDANDPTKHVNHTVGAYDVNAVIDGFTIRDGSATTGPTPEDQKGGGVLVYVFNNDQVPSVTVSRCEILDNTGLSGGGVAMAINNGKTMKLTVSDCDIHHNSTVYGGGGVFCSGECELTDTLIRSNTAGTSGGGLLAWAAIVADRVTFAENIASADAGGVMLQYGASTSTLTNLLFRGNRAGGGNGGGLLVDGTNASVKLVNAAFVGNSATAGGAVHDGTTGGFTCVSCTITANRGTAGGDGIKWTNVGPTLTNSIVWGNPSPASPANGNDVDPPTWAMVTASHSDIHGYTPTGGSVIDQSPMFVSLPAFFDWVASAMVSTTQITVASSTKYAVGDVIEIGGDGKARTVSMAAGGVVTFAPGLGAPAAANASIRNWGSALGTIDMHVGMSSPCVNTADPASATATDIEGKARVGAPDIGAYESH
jgi:hypothetical protein